MQVIFRRLRSAKERISASDRNSETDNVVLINTRWVAGIRSSMACKESKSDRGSPPVNTKSQAGVRRCIHKILDIGCDK